MRVDVPPGMTPVHSPGKGGWRSANIAAICALNKDNEE